MNVLIILVIFISIIVCILLYNIFNLKKNTEEPHIEKIYDDMYKKDMIEKIYNNNTVENYEIPKIIWCYWEDSILPKKVNEIYSNNVKILNNWKIILLNKNNIYNYIPKNDFPINYKKLSIAAKSDFIRLYLLKTYGGIWTDISILYNSQQIFNDIVNNCISKQAQLCAFVLGDETFIESWFIIAPKNSIIIEKWFEEFNNAVNIGFYNYKKNIFQEGIHINERIYKRNDDNVYLTIHACLQTALQKFQIKENMILYNAGYSMFKLHCDSSWKVDVIKSKYNENKFKYPFIKLRGCDR
jgi:hypothetical protein